MTGQVRNAAVLAQFEARQAERCAVSVTRASVRELGQHPVAAELIDLSIYGCRLATSELLDVDSRLSLRFDGGWPIAANVVWAKDGQLGCRFDKPIANAMMRTLTRR